MPSSKIQKIAKKIDQKVASFIQMEQVHGTKIAIVGKKDSGQEIKGVDSLITNETGVFLLARLADCLPVFFFDPLNKIIALSHSGWRGCLGKNCFNSVRWRRTRV